MLVAAAAFEGREKPSTYSSRRPGRQVPTSVGHVAAPANSGGYGASAMPIGTFASGLRNGD